MTAIIDGKFNPKCVRFDGNGASTVFLNEHGWRLECDSIGANILRDDLKTELESALGRKLEDYKETEKIRYFTFARGLDGKKSLYRCCDGWSDAQEFEDGKWISGRGMSIGHWKDEPELTEAEAIQFAGRAGLGLPPEPESEETGMWWDIPNAKDCSGALLYKPHGHGLQLWYSEVSDWRDSNRDTDRALRTPATRSSIIEKYGEAPLR